MEIVDLTEARVAEWLVCLEEHSPVMAEAGDAKRRWFEREKERGLRVKLALDERGTAGGMIQYVPFERSTLDGEGGCFVQCLWIHSYKEGRGDFRGRGMGPALLEAAERGARERGARGIAAQGLLLLPFWQRARWFRRHGYSLVDRMSLLGLLWKPFDKDARAPRWIRPGPPPPRVPGKVSVTAYVGGWCPGQNIALERTRRASAEFGDAVVFREVEVPDREAFRREGHADEVFVDGRSVRNGPPMAYEAIRRMIEKRVRRLR